MAWNSALTSRVAAGFEPVAFSLKWIRRQRYLSTCLRIIGSPVDVRSTHIEARQVFKLIDPGALSLIDLVDALSRCGRRLAISTIRRCGVFEKITELRRKFGCTAGNNGQTMREVDPSDIGSETDVRQRGSAVATKVVHVSRYESDQRRLR